MKRRDLLIGLGAAAAAAAFGPLAQQPATKYRRVGFLSARWRSTASSPDAYYDAFVRGMRELGYVNGKNVVIEYRWADGKYERLPELAADLVRLKVDVLVTHATPGSLAAKRATSTIPVVMAAVADPVATGVVTRLARSGGNFTGSAIFVPELMAKRLELLKETAPRVTRVAVLLHPDNSSSALVLNAMEVAARSLKLHLQRFDARGAGDMENAFSAMTTRRVDAVVVLDDPIFQTQAATTARLAALQRLPAAGSREFGEAGGMIGYGANLPEMYRRAAYFVDRLLRGAKPDDLPIERASKFELVINRRTASALGINIAQSILLRADKVIE